MVTFSYLNLAEDTYPSLSNSSNAMDMIFCRNVLMYFALDRVKQVVQNFYRSLVEGGWLIVSPSEVSQALFPQFVAVNFSGATLYKKDNQGSQSVGDALSKETPVCASPDKPLARLASEFVAESRLEVMSSPSGTDRTATEPKIAKPGRTPYQEGLALYEQGQYVEDVEKLGRLSSPDQATPKAMTLLVRAYANQGQLVEALAWCQKTIAANSLDPGSHYLCAIILQEQNLIDEAIASLKRALYLDPDFILAHFTLGNLALRQRKLKKAAKYFDNALALLRTYRPEDITPASEGITAGRLIEVIRSTIQREGLA
jgi:chemotaxis protein methyltransferase CheR